MAEKKSGNLKGINTGIKILIFIAGSVIVVLSKFAFIFFTIAMLPSFTAIFIDKRINKYASSTLCAFNLIGLMPYVFNISKSPDSNAIAQSYLTNIYVWFVIYSSTALGCFIIWTFPEFTAKIFQIRAEGKIRKIQEDQEKLCEEWGEDIISRAKIN